jgi:hypothetical protein
MHSMQCAVPKVAYYIEYCKDLARPSFVAVMDTVQEVAERVTSFLKTKILEPKKNDIEVTAELVSRGIYALTSVQCTRMELAQINRSQTQAAHTAENQGVQESEDSQEGQSVEEWEELSDLVGTLFECIGSAGQTLAHYTAEDQEEEELLHETASICALSLTHLVAFAQKISVDQWHALGWTLLSATGTMSAKLCTVLTRNLQLHHLHQKFLAYACLLSGDKELVLQASQALGVAAMSSATHGAESPTSRCHLRSISCPTSYICCRTTRSSPRARLWRWRMTRDV